MVLFLLPLVDPLWRFYFQGLLAGLFIPRQDVDKRGLLFDILGLDKQFVNFGDIADTALSNVVKVPLQVFLIRLQVLPAGKSLIGVE